MTKVKRRKMRQAKGPDVMCPGCGEMINGWTETGHGNAPSPGDWSVCIYCTKVLVFDDKLRPVQPSPEQEAEAATNPLIQQIRAKAFLEKELYGISTVPPNRRGKPFH